MIRWLFYVFSSKQKKLFCVWLKVNSSGSSQAPAFHFVINLPPVSVFPSNCLPLWGPCRCLIFPFVISFGAIHLRVCHWDQHMICLVRNRHLSTLGTDDNTWTEMCLTVWVSLQFLAERIVLGIWGFGQDDCIGCRSQSTWHEGWGM